MNPEMKRDLQDRLAALRARLIELVREHERLVTQGQPSLVGRLAIVGYFGHALGLHHHHAMHLAEMLEEYDRTCTGKHGPQQQDGGQPCQVPPATEARAPVEGEGEGGSMPLPFFFKRGLS